MKRLLIAFIFVFVVDWYIKSLILGGLRADWSCISIIFVLNDGVAFSMFAFLQEWLKYIQLALIIGVAVWFYREKSYFEKFSLEAGLILGGGIGNNLDRFVHGGVVDYVYWHCGFDFAIFNFADVMIDAGAGLIILRLLMTREKQL